MRVVVMSGRRLFGDSVAAVLRVHSDVSAVDPVTSPERLLSACERTDFDVAVLDADRDAAAVLPLCQRLRERFRSIFLVVVYDKLSPAALSALRMDGVNALVPVSRGLATLVATVRFRRAGSPSRQPVGLSRRQRDVLMLLGSGHSVPEIAALLDISPGTVENHKRRMYAKLDAQTTGGAVARAAEFGMLGDGSGPPEDDADQQQPARHPDAKAGHALIVVVHGTSDAVVNQAVEVLIRHRIPVFHEYLSRSSRSDHWSRWHRGPLVLLLVDPAEDGWRNALGQARPIIVHYSTPADPAQIDDAFSRGAAAVLPAGWLDHRLVHLLSVVSAGCRVVERTHGAPHLLGLRMHPTEPNPTPDLTARECDILRSIACGHTVRETARTLGIAAKTVENAQSYLFRKLGAHNRPSALVAAHALGLLPNLPAGPAGRLLPRRPPGGLAARPLGQRTAS
jgi:two-component system, NarL family, nitrate/nitrite response regulator NarL